MEKILVTGSTGFIGKHLIKELDSKKVVEFSKSLGFDITDKNSFDKINEKVSLIYHLAAKIFVPDCNKNQQETDNINVEGTKNILEFAKLNNSKVVFLSSAAVYGSPEYLPINEVHPTNPVNIYGKTKLKAEKLILKYNEKYGIDYVILRGFNAYGPGQNKKFVIPDILDKIKKEKVIINDSRPKRDFIYISDIVCALIKAGKSNKNGIFNIGSGKSYSIGDVLNKLVEISGKEVDINYANKIRANETSDIYADISKAKKFFNWEPKVLLSCGLKKVYQNE